jgi:glycosyltransferase involved in cell wall biosynthesis
VILPNYNYAQFITERLAAIFAQTHPIHELIILDDASTDNRVKVIEQYPQENSHTAILLFSKENSNHVFTQWQRGLEAETGDFIWFAEADDSAHRSF